jgi:hypothetical protein
MQSSSQKYALGFALTAVGLIIACPGFSQGPGANPELQTKVAALKQAVAQNQQALRQYTWTETTQMIFKGETKSTKQALCQYGPDGKVQKTAIGGDPPPPEKKRGVRGRVIEKKKDEMKDYMERVASLIKRYVPPEGSQIQESFQSGKAALKPSAGGGVTILFADYAKPGDSVALAFDTAANKIQGYDVKTYLDSPQDVVSLKISFHSLPDGTNHVAQSVLDATAKQIQIKTTNSHYNKR